MNTIKEPRRYDSAETENYIWTHDPTESYVTRERPLIHITVYGEHRPDAIYAILQYYDEGTWRGGKLYESDLDALDLIRII